MMILHRDPASDPVLQGIAIAALASGVIAFPWAIFILRRQAALPTSPVERRPVWLRPRVVGACRRRPLRARPSLEGRMQLIRFCAETSDPITEFGSVSAGRTALAHGDGEVHAYAVHVAPGGFIGPHVAGFDQLFLVVQGSGWASGPDGVRIPVPAGCGAFFRTGELHSKGSELGLLAIMVQASSLARPAAPRGG